MKNNSKLLGVLCLIVLLGTSVVGSSQTVLTIDGGYLVQNSNSVIRLNNTQFINNGTFEAAANSNVLITGDGTDEQSAIGGNSVTTFHRVEISKSSNGVQLQQDMSINQELVFEEGNLDLNGNIITLASDAYLEIESEESRLVGPNGGLVQITVDLNAPNYSPGGIGLRITSSQNLGTTLIQRAHVPVSLNGTESIERVYKIFPTNNSELDATLKLDYFEAELNGHSESELGVWRQDDEFWYNPSSTANLNINQFTLENVDYLSEEWTLASRAPQLQARVLLQGPHDSGTTEMTDDLRTSSLIPTDEPYAALGYDHPASGGNEKISSTVLSTTGSNAIVDWVFVELRDPANTNNVLAARSALLQRDGDIVDLDGKSALSFPDVATNQTAYIAVRHRNHLGIIAAGVSDLATTPIVLDFSINPNLAVGGTAALGNVGNGQYALFSGDFDGNGQVQNTDSNAQNATLGASGNLPGDSDLNGQVQNTDLQIKLTPNLGRGAQFSY